MKRCISLLVAVALLLGLVPAAAFAKTTATPSPVSRGTNVRARGVKDEPGLVTWDFEVNPTATGWTFEDSDGDGNNWNWVQDSTYAHESTGSIMSASYSGSALSPDNWAISPVFTLASEDPTISFWVRNYSGTYPETFGVFIRRAGTEQFTDVATNLSVTGSTYVQVSYPITTFAGEDVQIAIRHYNCSDQWRFYIDDVTVTGSIDESVITSINVTGFPTRIYAGQTPADVLANVAVPEDAHYIIDQLSAYDVEADEELYDDDEFVEGKSYLFGAMVETDLDYTFADGAVLMANNGNLELDPGYSSVTTYVAYVVPVALVCGGDAPIYGWYFETSDELDGWSALDSDGDGSSWYWLDADSLGEPLAYEGVGYMGSPSWNSVALTPDNYLFTPEMEIPEGTTTLSFYAAGVGASYCAEHFAVYVMTEDTETIDDLVAIIPETVATADYVNYTADLSDYAGQTIQVLFRHFNCTDMNWFRLDQVEVFNEAPEAELIPIDAVAIEGFTVPAWDENPDFDVTVPEDAHYSIDYTAWLCDGEQMIRQDVFDSETSAYMMSIVVVPDEGYEIAEDAEATINGSSEYVGVAGFTEEGTFRILTVEFNVENTVIGPPMSDLDMALNISGSDALHFESEGNYPWFTVTEEDRFYAQSGNWGVSSSTSVLTTTVTVEAGDALSFEFKAWGEGTGTFWDHCDFYVGEERVLYYGAYDNEWETFIYVFEEAGTYDLTWSYTKDSSVNPSGDYFAVDNVTVGEAPDVTVTFVDGLTDEILATLEVPMGTVLVEADFPEAPEHAGYIFTGWDYSGDPVNSDTTVTAMYQDPNSIIWDFETNPINQGFQFIDQDGDGFNWQWHVNTGSGNHTTHGGDGVATSASYDNDSSTALNPDNWMITPEFTATTLSFWLVAQDTSYADDYLEVYVSTDGGETWSEALWSGFSPTAYAQYTIDLSAYSGTKNVAFRHFNCNDMFMLNVDDIEVSGAAEPPEPQIIEEIEINGFVVPVYGEAPAYDYTVPEDAHYSIVYTDWNWWSDVIDDGDIMGEGELFDDPSSVYYAYFQIVPEEGYEISDDATVLINGSDEYVDLCGWNTNMGYFYVFTVDFEVEQPAQPTLDEALNVEGGELHFESEGDYPWFVVEDDDRLFAQSGNAGVNSSTSVLTTTVTVEAYDVLTFEFRAWGEGTGTFWDHCDFYVGEERVLYYGAYDNEWETFTYTFTEAGEYTLTWSYTKDYSVNPSGDYFQVDNVALTEGEPPETQIIEEIEINDFEIPVWGANPDFDFTVPEGAHYFIEEVGWNIYDPETGDDTMAPEDVFDNPNATYYAVIILGCEEGYDFPDEAVVMINGETALVDFGFGYEGEYYIATVDFTVEEPASGTYGDVDLDGIVEAEDALLAMRYAMGLIELTDEQLAQMDVNGDGVYDLVDAVLILRYAMGLIDHFPIEE